MNLDDDARDLAIHASIDYLLQKIMETNGFTRLQALERIEAFAENERDEMQERQRRSGAEARA
jgi:hypothetical protein